MKSQSLTLESVTLYLSPSTKTKDPIHLLCSSNPNDSCLLSRTSDSAGRLKKNFYSLSKTSTWLQALKVLKRETNKLTPSSRTRERYLSFISLQDTCKTCKVLVDSVTTSLPLLMLWLWANSVLTYLSRLMSTTLQSLTWTPSSCPWCLLWLKNLTN